MKKRKKMKERKKMEKMEEERPAHGWASAGLLGRPGLPKEAAGGKKEVA